MRLIDAEELINNIIENGFEFIKKGCLVLTNSNATGIVDVISKEPTAYDVDKVVKKLKANSDITNYGEKYGISLKRAVEIVQKGGGADA